MNVILLTSSASIGEQIYNAALATLTCTGIEDKLDAETKNPNAERLMLGGRRPMTTPDKETYCVNLLKRRIQDGHESVIEHVNLSFQIEGISRALLQELARHRHASLSVYSTRWTLGKGLLNADFDTRTTALNELLQAIQDRGKALDEKLMKDGHDTDGLFAGEFAQDFFNCLKRVLNIVATCTSKPGKYADFVKYFLPELLPTRLVWTCNLRELRHVFYLRTSTRALLEFQNLCAAIKDTLPDALKELATI